MLGTARYRRLRRSHSRPQHAFYHAGRDCARPQRVRALAAGAGGVRAESTWTPNPYAPAGQFSRGWHCKLMCAPGKFIAKYEQLHAACNVRQCPTALVLGNVTMTTGRGYSAGLIFHFSTCNPAAGFRLLQGKSG